MRLHGGLRRVVEVRFAGLDQERPAVACGTVLAEKVLHAEANRVGVVLRYLVARAHGLHGLAAGLEAHVHFKVAAGDVLFGAENLKRPHECAAARFGVQPEALDWEERGEHDFRRALHVFRVAFGALLHVAEVGLRLPAEGPEPVGLGLGHVLAVCLGVFLVHEFVECLLHGVLAVGEATAACQAVHERPAHLSVERGPGGGIGEGNYGSGIERH